MTTTASAAASTVTSSAVDRLLSAIESGTGGETAECLAPGAVLDATVPDWRFHRVGPDAIAAQFAEWFANPGTFEELRRISVTGGEVVTYLLNWEEQGVPHAAHQCHVISLDEETGKISRVETFCGGVWDATLLARMAAADHGH